MSKSRPAASPDQTTASERWRLPVNLANTITGFRILLIPVFLVFLLQFELVPYSVDIAVAIFILAAITDTLDGYFARSRNAVTVLGQVLDPVADKLLISAALIALVSLGRIPAWIAMLIIAREFSVSGLRLVAATSRIVIPASPLGKIKTLSQVVAVAALLLPGFGFVLGRPLSWYLIYPAALLTVISGIDYFARARVLLRPQ